MGTEDHSGLGFEERYNHPLRETFRTPKLSYPAVDDPLQLRLCVKEIIETLGREGLELSALVFRELSAYLYAFINSRGT